MTSQRMADLLYRSKSVVDHWLMNPELKGYKEPPRDVKAHLSAMYVIYRTLQTLRKSLSRTTLRILNEVLDDQEDEDEDE